MTYFANRAIQVNGTSYNPGDVISAPNIAAVRQIKSLVRSRRVVTDADLAALGWHYHIRVRATQAYNNFVTEYTPTITTASPNTGGTAGGDSVVITGTRFTGATQVKFGTSNAASFTVDSDTQITAVTPALAAGSRAISVITPVATSATKAFTVS